MGPRRAIGAAGRRSAGYKRRTSPQPAARAAIGPPRPRSHAYAGRGRSHHKQNKQTKKCAQTPDETEGEDPGRAGGSWGAQAHRTGSAMPQPVPAPPCRAVLTFDGWEKVLKASAARGDGRKRSFWMTRPLLAIVPAVSTNNENKKANKQRRTTKNEAT